MGMHLTGLHLLVTYRCTYACSHCFVWGSPDLEDTMSIAQLRDAVDQAVALGSVEIVYFEGGEPTLSYPVLLEAAAHAWGKGMDFGLVTNCFWATTVEDAALWLRPFKDLGIADLSVSAYPYADDEPVDDTHLRNAIQAAQRLDLPLEVLEVASCAQVADLGVRCGDPGELMYRGRAAVELAPAAARRPPDSLTTCPYEDLASPDRVHLGSDGELQVCQGLSAGNVWRAQTQTAGAPAQHATLAGTGLRNITDAYDPARMPVFRELLAGGPLQLARAYDLEPLRDLYADECHLCYELRARLREQLPDVLAPAVCYGPPDTAPTDPGP